MSRITAGLGPTNVTCPGAADQTDSDGDGVGDACEPYGTWQRTAGMLFRDTSPTVQWIALGADGSGQLRLVGDAGDVTCGSFVFAREGRATLTLEGDANVSVLFQPTVVRYARPAADTLQLTDAVISNATAVWDDPNFPTAGAAILGDATTDVRFERVLFESNQGDGLGAQGPGTQVMLTDVRFAHGRPDSDDTRGRGASAYFSR